MYSVMMMITHTHYTLSSMYNKNTRVNPCYNPNWWCGFRFSNRELHCLPLKKQPTERLRSTEYTNKLAASVFPMQYM